MLNQRRFARRAVKVLWLGLIPLAAGLAVKQAHTSPKELVHRVKRWGPRKQLHYLKPSSGSLNGGGDEQEESEEDEAQQNIGSDQHRKRFFWF